MTAGHSFLFSTAKSLRMVFASVSSRCTVRSAAARGSRAASTASRACRCAASAACAAASASVSTDCAPATPRVGFARHIAKVVLYGIESAERGLGIGNERALPRQIGGELLDATIEFGDPFLGARLLAFEGFARDNQPLQRGGGFGFGLAERWQRGGGLRLPGRRLGVLAHARRDDPDSLVLAAPGVLDLAAGANPAQMEQQSLGAPHLRGNITVAHRLARLALERGHLAGKLADDVVNPC